MRFPFRSLPAVAWAFLALGMGCVGDRGTGTGGGEGMASAEQEYDLIIRGGRVVDGSGGSAFDADVGIRGDRIVRLAREGLPEETAGEVLDARGLFVAPGFVDHHAHIQTRIHEYPLAENFTRQGITTILASLHSGDQPWPLDAYIASLRTAPNVGFFAGHTWIREQVLGTKNRAPDAGELERMKALVKVSMEQGALGLSTGLLYVPGHYAETEEVIELARVAAEYGGVYYSHMRDEARGLLASVRELVRIADEAGIPAQVQHHKAMGPGQWGWTRESLAIIDSARAAGLDVTHDVYPYTAGSTGSQVLFPPWSLAGGPEAFRRRVADPDTLERMKVEMREMWAADWVGDDLARIQFRRLPRDPSFDGRTLADLAAARGLPNTVEAGMDLALELQVAGGFSAIYHFMDEADVVRIMRHPWAMFQTDGDPVGYGVGFPHPRSYGSFPRVLARYVRELEVLTLEEAVRRMTWLSMQRIGQTERGLVREGMYADLVLFNPDGVRDLADFTNPHQFPVGIPYVIVNGVPIIRNGALTGEKPGRVLKGPRRHADPPRLGDREEEG